MINNARTPFIRRTPVVASAAALLAVTVWLVSSRESTSRGAGATASQASAVLVSEQKGKPASAVATRRNEPRAFVRGQRPTDAPIRATELLSADARRVAATVVSGRERAVYVGRESESMTCLILQDRTGGGGGCNRAADAFADSSVWWSSVHSNYPSQELTIFGVVSDGVEAVRLASKNGDETALPLSPDGGFIHVITKDKILPADVPDRIVSLDRDGNVVESIPLGITFGQ
jgi:hypothetical protein